MTEKTSVERLRIPAVAVKTPTIAILTAFTPEVFRSEYLRQVISGIVGSLVSSHYHLKLTMVREEELAEGVEKIFRKHSLDGVLLLTWRLLASYLEGDYEAEKGIPIVAINDYKPGIKFNMVYSDAAAGARLAMRFLINRGYRRIGMIQAPDEDSFDARERESVFREVLKEAGVELDPSHFKKCDYFFEEDGYIKTMEMIHTAPTLPRALLCYNDDLAIGAIRALREEKILVPQQVAVIGFDGTERGKYVNPPLTTISQPLERMGREMVRIVTSLIRGELSRPVHLRFDPQLVIRQSA